MIEKSDVSIIIPTMWTERNWYALKQCLASLQESEFPRENIIVVSNNDNLKMHPISDMTIKKQGQCGAVNAAIATVNTPWIMVTNDDMIYPPDWFERLVFGMTKKMFCISPQLVEPIDGAPTFVKYFCGGVGGDFDKKKFMDYAANNQRDHFDANNWREWDYYIRSGFNLPFLMKKEVWDMVGGYDVNYDPWSSNSDSDLEYKLKLAGIDMYQNTNCPVYHFSQTSGTFHPDNHSYWQKNYQYFTDKWGFERVGSPQIWEASFEIPYEKLKYRPKWAVIPGEQGAESA